MTEIYIATPDLETQERLREELASLGFIPNYSTLKFKGLRVEKISGNVWGTSYLGETFSYPECGIPPPVFEWANARGGKS